jgi:REP element-mobilizing transposase RayT
MILASHVIFGAYGFWLPNDPRGSWSDFVASWELHRFGKASKVETTQSLAHAPHNREARLAAKTSLRFPAVQFSGLQAKAVGTGFGSSLEKGRITCLACAILPEHIHMVLVRHGHKPELLVNLLKGAASRSLAKEGIHPLAKFKKPDGRIPKCWSRGQWKVYLDCEEEVRHAVAYVEDNPIKEGKPAQRWTFVTPLEAWLSRQQF